MYTKEQLMPKRYPKNKPKGEGYYHTNYAPYNPTNGKWCWCGDRWFSPDIDREIHWFIDIPDAPEEVRPLTYPENRPKENKLVYPCHLSDHDQWTTLIYIDGKWGAGYRVDYFIDIPIDAEGGLREARIADLVKEIAELKEYVIDELIKILDGWGYDVVKRQPEIAPCPNPECQSGCSIEADNNDNPHYYQVICHSCYYHGPKYTTIEGARYLHNLVAGKAAK